LILAAGESLEITEELETDERKSHVFTAQKVGVIEFV
jgi:hypothetical protein